MQVNNASDVINAFSSWTVKHSVHSPADQIIKVSHNNCTTHTTAPVANHRTVCLFYASTECMTMFLQTWEINPMCVISFLYLTMHSESLHLALIPAPKGGQFQNNLVGSSVTGKVVFICESVWSKYHQTKWLIYERTPVYRRYNHI